MSVPMYVNLQERLRVEREEAEVREEQIRVLCAEYYDLKRVHESTMEENSRMAAQHSEMLQQNGEMRGSYHSLEEQIQELESRNADLQTFVESLQQEIAGLKKIIDEKDAQMQHEHQLCADLQSSVEEKEVEIRRVKKDLKFSWSETEQLRHRLDLTTEKKKEIEALYGEDKDRIERMRRLVDAKDRQRLRAEELKKKADDECDAHKKREKLLEFHLKQVTDGFQDMEAKYNALFERNREMHAENRKLCEELSASLKKESSREKQLSQLWTEVEYWKSAVATAEAAEDEFSKLRARYADPSDLAQAVFDGEELLSMVGQGWQTAHSGQLSDTQAVSSQEYVSQGSAYQDQQGEYNETYDGRNLGEGYNAQEGCQHHGGDEEEEDVYDAPDREEYYRQEPTNASLPSNDASQLKHRHYNSSHPHPHCDPQQQHQHTSVQQMIPLMDTLAVAEVTCGAFLSAVETMEADETRKNELKKPMQKTLQSNPDALRLRAEKLRQKNSNLLKTLQDRSRMLRTTVSGSSV
eukprot:ANDGO_05326.mRNA.1 hypothetical protein